MTHGSLSHFVHVLLPLHLVDDSQLPPSLAFLPNIILPRYRPTRSLITIHIYSFPQPVAFFISFYRNAQERFLHAAPFNWASIVSISFFGSRLLPFFLNFQRLLSFIICIIHSYHIFRPVDSKFNFPLPCSSIFTASRDEKLDICESQNVLYFAYCTGRNQSHAAPGVPWIFLYSQLHHYSGDKCPYSSALFVP